MAKPTNYMYVIDPIKFKNLLWPEITFYKQQLEVIYSVCDNKETYVPAANMMGKDFVAGFIALYFFLTRHPCRVVTTSAKDDHLRVLWGEINDLIQKARANGKPMTVDQGGPLIVNHQDIRKVWKGEKCAKSYITGLVASPNSIAAMQGHHIAQTGDGIPRTLFIPDECSSVPDEYYTMASTWFNRMLAIGNTWECSNFWKNGVTQGDVPDPTSKTGALYRKIIHIAATESPNVRFALSEIEGGKVPSDKVIVPGVMPWAEYQYRLNMYDDIRKCVTLDAKFYEGKDIKLFPREWLDQCKDRARNLYGRRRKAKAMGCDPGEGGDDSCWTIGDEYGVIELIAKKTPDTNDVFHETLRLIRQYSLPADRVCFDRGGGGKEHADRLRDAGYGVRTVAFGEPIAPEPKYGTTQVSERVEQKEERYVFKNRRAQMFGEFSAAIDPANPNALAIPDEYAELYRQLAGIPKTYDGEGRLFLIPKRKKNPESTERTLSDILGCSPDEADSTVLYYHALTHDPRRAIAGPGI